MKEKGNQMSYTTTIVTRKPKICKRTFRSRYRKLAPLRTWKQEFDAGQAAFHRGKFPKATWSRAMSQGWDFAGYVAHLACVESDSIGYSESTQAYNW